MDTIATMRVATIHPRSERIFRLHVRKREETKYAHHPRMSAASDSTINTEISVENSTSVIVMLLMDKGSEFGSDYCWLGFLESSERT